ncbi:amino acid ABC transporter substrate-binding protein, PAAT family [Paramicrobacterium humi]|uniref:Amino acid ABC transporter substrate-binding protein, PAAT family n=1 Tax=Paramicrobacterium humi TaxID=640635 RepID=A0A1H4PUL1_9MICO|nr:glutamate ABC transporter substrate-binding protein [Microbacterium humi]SEC11115.1 amino acid ABC transporter substrate-binding protein, PAAT family [Microbacterium humi]
MRKGLTLFAAAAAAALVLSGCAGDEPSGTPGGSGDEGAKTSSLYEVNKNVDLEGSPTYDAAKKADKITIGVKEDQPGLGYKDAVSGERSGFDIEIAKWMAASLGFSDKQITFEAIPSANREQALVNGDIDLYVGTYSITDKRKEMVDFAGPYFITGQGLLVLKDNDEIKSDADLAGKKVCSATGSTPIQNIRDNYKDATPVEFDVYSQCVDALKDGSVDAVTTDEAILLGYAAQDPDNLKVVGKPFTTEKYGIGIPKGDDALRHYLNKVLTDGNDTWEGIYDATLGKSGTKVEQPAVDDY